MDRDLLAALKAYVDARIDEKISDAFGRDSLHEIIHLSDAERALDKAASDRAPADD